jgi:hypothetical protein
MTDLEDRVESIIKDVFSSKNTMAYVVASLYDNPQGLTNGALSRVLKELPLNTPKSSVNNLKYRILTKLSADVATYTKDGGKLIWKLTDRARKIVGNLVKFTPGQHNPYCIAINETRLNLQEASGYAYPVKVDINPGQQVSEAGGK